MSSRTHADSRKSGFLPSFALFSSRFLGSFDVPATQHPPPLYCLHCPSMVFLLCCSDHVNVLPCQSLPRLRMLYPLSLQCLCIVSLLSLCCLSTVSPLSLHCVCIVSFIPCQYLTVPVSSQMSDALFSLYCLCCLSVVYLSSRSKSPTRSHDSSPQPNDCLLTMMDSSHVDTSVLFQGTKSCRYQLARQATSKR
jgi:hypothetical protein